MTTDDLINIREISKRDDIFDILGRSIAPSIFGYSFIKQVFLYILYKLFNNIFNFYLFLIYLFFRLYYYNY